MVWLKWTWLTFNFIIISMTNKIKSIQHFNGHHIKCKHNRNWVMRCYEKWRERMRILVKIRKKPLSCALFSLHSIFHFENVSRVRKSWAKNPRENEKKRARWYNFHLILLLLLLFYSIQKKKLVVLSVFTHGNGTFIGSACCLIAGRQYELYVQMKETLILFSGVFSKTKRLEKY